MSKITLKYEDLQEILNLSLKEINKLKHIDLSGNMVAQIDPTLFDELPNLTSIDLSHNLLTSLDLHNPLNRVTSLDISNNRFDNLIFLSNFPHLQNLSCRGNPFEHYQKFLATYLCKELCWVDRQPINNRVSSDAFVYQLYNQCLTHHKDIGVGDLGGMVDRMVKVLMEKRFLGVGLPSDIRKIIIKKECENFFSKRFSIRKKSKLNSTLPLQPSKSITSPRKSSNTPIKTKTNTPVKKSFNTPVKRHATTPKKSMDTASIDSDSSLSDTHSTKITQKTTTMKPATTPKKHSNTLNKTITTNQATHTPAKSNARSIHPNKTSTPIVPHRTPVESLRSVNSSIKSFRATTTTTFNATTTTTTPIKSLKNTTTPMKSTRNTTTPIETCVLSSDNLTRITRNTPKKLTTHSNNNPNTTKTNNNSNSKNNKNNTHNTPTTKPTKNTTKIIPKSTTTPKSTITPNKSTTHPPNQTSTPSHSLLSPLRRLSTRNTTPLKQQEKIEGLNYSQHFSQQNLSQQNLPQRNVQQSTLHQQQQHNPPQHQFYHRSSQYQQQLHKKNLNASMYELSTTTKYNKTTATKQTTTTLPTKHTTLPTKQTTTHSTIHTTNSTTTTPTKRSKQYSLSHTTPPKQKKNNNDDNKPNNNKSKRVIVLDSDNDDDEEEEEDNDKEEDEDDDETEEEYDAKDDISDKNEKKTNNTNNYTQIKNKTITTETTNNQAKNRPSRDITSPLRHQYRVCRSPVNQVRSLNDSFVRPLRLRRVTPAKNNNKNNENKNNIGNDKNTNYDNDGDNKNDDINDNDITENDKENGDSGLKRSFYSRSKSAFKENEDGGSFDVVKRKLSFSPRKMVLPFSGKSSKIHKELPDYDPIIFLRCHSGDRKALREGFSLDDPNDNVTNVWACAFEPDPQYPDKDTGIVATCGGSMVCLIDVGSGKVMKRWELHRGQFYCLAWTTIEMAGKKVNILAVSGHNGFLKLICPQQLLCYHQHGNGRPNKQVKDFYYSHLTFHPTHHTWLFCSSSDCTVTLWDIGIPSVQDMTTIVKRLAVFNSQPVAMLSHMAYLLERDWLLAASGEGLMLWEIKEANFDSKRRTPLKVLDNGDDSSVDALCVLDDMRIALKYIGHPFIMVYDLIKFDLIFNLPWVQTEVDYIGICSYGDMLVAGTNRGDLLLYDVTCPTKPPHTLEWPICKVDRDDMKDVLEDEDRVLNNVCIDKSGGNIVAVSDCNLVCIWKKKEG